MVQAIEAVVRWCVFESIGGDGMGDGASILCVALALFVRGEWDEFGLADSFLQSSELD